MDKPALKSCAECGNSKTSPGNTACNKNGCELHVCRDCICPDCAKCYRSHCECQKTSQRTDSQRIADELESSEDPN